MKKKKLKKELDKTTDRAFGYMELCERLRNENRRLERENECLIKLSNSLKVRIAKRKKCCKKLNTERKKAHSDLSAILPEVPIRYSGEQIEKSRQAMENAAGFTGKREESDMLSEKLSSVLKAYRPNRDLKGLP